MQSAEHLYGMTLDWESNDVMELWNQRTAQVVELFGLPGDRYVTDVSANDMTFWFRDPHDALLFRLCHGRSRLHQA